MNKLMVFSVMSIVVLALGCIETGKGSSTDTIYGMEYNGLIWKTYTVYLTNDHPSYGQTTSYSAKYSVSKDDMQTIQKIKDAIESKSKVKILYRNEFWVWPWDYSSDVIIYDVVEKP